MLKSMTFRSTLAAVACALSFSVHAMADSSPKKVEIAAGDLRPALLQLSRTFGVELLYQPSQLDHFRTTGVRGEYTPEAAVRLLLKGTPLELRTDPSGAMMIIDPKAPHAASVSALSEQAATAPGSADGSQPPRSLQLAQANPGANAGAATPAVVTRETNGRAEQLQEVLVTAQKRAERLQDVPISMSVLSGGDLDKSTFSGVTDALNTVPGVAAVNIQNSFGGTMLSIRGVSASDVAYGGASSVAYYVDSVPFGMMRSALLPNPNIYDLQQIEVLRGPQGTLYGANALNGVVRILTNDPELNGFDFKARGVISTTETGGSNYAGDMAVNVPIIDGILGVRASVGDDHESGWINGPLGDHLNHSDLGNERIKLSARPTDALRIDLSAWHSQTDSPIASSQSDNTGRITAQHEQPTYTQFNAYGAKVIYDSTGFSASSMTSYIDYNSSTVTDVTPVGENATVTSTFVSDVFAEEVNLTSKLDGPWRWTIGAMYRHDKEENHQYLLFYPPPVTSLDFDRFNDSSNSGAVYGELGRRFSHDQFQWTLGLRYFHDDESTQAVGPIPGLDVPQGANRVTSSATTPRVVLSWFPTKYLTTYASFSQGFRSGVPQDELVGAEVPNFPSAKPDKLTNYELGVKGTLWDRALSFDAAVFYMDWRDIQQSIGLHDPRVGFISVLINGDSASGEGAEISLRTQPLKGISLGADFGWNNLHFDSTVNSYGTVLFPEGSRPNYSPEYTAGLFADYGFAMGNRGVRGVFSGSANYVSPLATTFVGANAGMSGANSLLLTRGSFSVEFPEHWELSVFVDNANNYNGSQVRIAGVPEWSSRVQPRTYGVRFQYHLN